MAESIPQRAKVFVVVRFDPERIDPAFSINIKAVFSDEETAKNEVDRLNMLPQQDPKSVYLLQASYLYGSNFFHEKKLRTT